MSKFSEKLAARKMRSDGESIKNIAKKIGVSVSSVSAWCRDIEMSQEQILALQMKARDPFYAGRGEYIARKKKELNQKIKNLRTAGVAEIGEVTKRELFLIGVALYWSEGFKKDSQVGFANSNPKMIKLFIKWLYSSCGYSRDDLLVRLTLNISHKHREEEVKEYWSNVTGVPLAEFRKTFYQNVKWQKVYENPTEYYGVLRIKVRKSTDFLRKLHGWIEGLSLQA